jgi:Guanylate kinase
MECFTVTTASVPCVGVSCAKWLQVLSTLSPLPGPNSLSLLGASPLDRRPLAISGPSGVGKGTLYKLLFTRYPDTFTLSVSHTTRSPRPGEQDGVDYHYVSKDKFRELIAEEGFIE